MDGRTGETLEEQVVTARDPATGASIDRVLATRPEGVGDVVILRGVGPGGPESRCPLHSLGPPATERLTVSFRHKKTGPGGWAER